MVLVAGVLFQASSLGHGINVYQRNYVDSDRTLALVRADGKTWSAVQSVKVEISVKFVQRTKAQLADLTIEAYLENQGCFEDMVRAAMWMTHATYSNEIAGASLDDFSAFSKLCCSEKIFCLVMLVERDLS